MSNERGGQQHEAMSSILRGKKRLCEDKSSVVLTDAYNIAYKIEQAKYYPLRSMISLKPPADAPC